MTSVVAPESPDGPTSEARLVERNSWKRLCERGLHWSRVHVAGFAVILGGLYWVVDAIIHVLFQADAAFLEQLFPFDASQLWMRSLAVLLIIALGVSAQHAIDAQQRLKKEAEAARESAELAHRTKSQFLANTSHELRSPLNAIIGFAEIMRDELFGPIGVPQYKDYCEDIYASGTHLLELINDILDLSKVEAGKLELREEAVDIGSVVESCVRLVRVRAQEGQVTLETEIEPDLPPVYVDERKMKQVVLNLLSNAVKFTPEGGNVETSARVTAGGQLELVVADTGIGIAPEDMETAISAFGQVESTLSRKYEGTGLGLPLVKALVALHGGEFELTSEVAVGTRAIVTLPSSRVRRDAAARHRQTA